MTNYNILFNTTNRNNVFFFFRNFVRKKLIGYSVIKNFEKEILFIGQKANILDESKISDIAKQTMYDISKANIEIFINNKPNLFDFNINKLFAHISIITYKEKQKYKIKIIATMFGIMYFEWIENNTKKRAKIKKINGNNSAIYETMFSFASFNDLRNFCVLNGISLKYKKR